MIITKKDIIQKLYDIEEHENLKLGREVQRVVRSEVIPIDVITFINKYDKEFLQIYNTYNVIYSSRNKNPLYRNLRNKDLPTDEISIALSSLITKLCITISKIDDKDERKLFSNAMNMKEISEAICEYNLLGDSTKLLQCAKEVRELLQILYED